MGQNGTGISEWGFRNAFVAVTRELANTFIDANTSAETPENSYSLKEEK